MPNILNADTLALQQVCLPVRAPRRMPDRRETATIAAARGTWLKPSDFRANAAGELAVPTAKFLEGGSVVALHRKPSFKRRALSQSARLRRWSGWAALRRARVPSVDMDVVDQEGGRVRHLIDRPASAERKGNERVQRPVQLGRRRLAPHPLAIEKEHDGKR